MIKIQSSVKEITKKTVVVVMLVLFPLMLGGTIYICFFPDVWFVKCLCQLFNIQWNGLTTRVLVVNFVRNYFLDFLWAYSLTNALFCIISEHEWKPILPLFLTLLLGTVLEGLQLMGFALGIADVMDIIAETLGGITSAITFYIIRRTKHDEKKE